ncbi:MAG: tRNA 2-thiouridine(34) synthase MnmA [Chlamydiia bacterium]|nr:tRNA 2-thiouridine(34) synthase MnmA [Chlamydiia bacterium]
MSDLYCGKKVVVGLSGGVDSSVSAHLLKEKGALVTGLFMRNWSEDDECSAEIDYADVVSIANTLDIPHYTINFAKQYWNEVFKLCLEQFARGETPNPDILCNREIKFHHFLQKAIELGADYLATGHYCQRKLIDGKWCLLRGADPNKDQSYFLYTIQSKQLERVLFPIGGMNKIDVRAYAKKLSFVTASKKDSTGICFIGKRNFKEFLSRYLSKKIGPIETVDGKVIGEHEGAHFYTIGQRRGIGIGGEGDAWFVVDKKMESNTLVIVQGEDHPSLYHRELKTKQLSWVIGEPKFPLNCTAKIRYRSSDVPCMVFADGGVVFEEKQKAVTPGQSVVFYDGEICLGGGMIGERF